MNIETSLNAVWTSVSLLGLVYLVFWRGRILTEDWFRDKVFQLRDDLFDDATSGLIDFNHPAYGMLRQTMNGYIRFCHKLSLLHIIIMFMFREKPTNDESIFKINWKIVTKELDTEVLNKLENYRKQMEQLVAAYMIFSSPITSIVLLLFILLGMFVNSIERYRKNLVADWVENISNSESFEPVLINISDTAYMAGES